jgi:hypothetical protein
VMTEVLLRSISAASARGPRSVDVDEHGQRRRTEVDEHEQWQCTEVDEHGQQRRVEWAGPDGLVRVDGGTRRGVGRGPKS